MLTTFTVATPVEGLIVSSTCHSGSLSQRYLPIRRGHERPPDASHPSALYVHHCAAGSPRGSGHDPQRLTRAKRLGWTTRIRSWNSSWISCNLSRGPRAQTIDRFSCSPYRRYHDITLSRSHDDMHSRGWLRPPRADADMYAIPRLFHPNKPSGEPCLHAPILQSHFGFAVGHGV